MKNKKKLILVIQLLFVGLLFLFNTGCDNKNFSLPEVTTSAVTDITEVTATGGGTVTSDGGTDIFARGVCWNDSTGPTQRSATQSTPAGSRVLKVNSLP